MAAPANLWFGQESQFDSIRKPKLKHFQHYFWMILENQCSKFKLEFRFHSFDPLGECGCPNGMYMTKGEFMATGNKCATAVCFVHLTSQMLCDFWISLYFFIKKLCNVNRRCLCTNVFFNSCHQLKQNRKCYWCFGGSIIWNFILLQ